MLALASGVLIVARLLPPSPRGVGTHERLGLPPCPFLTLTGLPCAGCGLTTSFAHAAKFHFYEAFVTQPFGLLLFFVTAALVPVSCYFIYARISWSRVMNAVTANRAIIYALLALFLTSWIYKLAAVLSG